MKVYGIKNCSTVRNCLKFLDEKGVDYEFVDYKKNVPTGEMISKWIDALGDKIVINRRSLIWKKISIEERESVLDNDFIVVRENPSLIKRPLIEHDSGLITVGFDDDVQASIG